MYPKQFGGKITKQLTAYYEQSPNWRDGKFQNLETTTMRIDLHKLPKLLYKQFYEKGGREPARPLPVEPLDQNLFLSPADHAKFVWYGHSVVLMRINGKTLLIDPMLGPNAAPIAPFAVKRFSQNTLGLIDDFPEIDLMLLTHDHYDHLDLDSIEKLKGKTKKFFVALGVKRHLAKWGIDPETVTEFDWWDHQHFDDISITFTPSRHFSGRGLSDRTKSLWGGWVFNTGSENIWFSGDGGYGAHFQEIGKRLGPFDFGMMECGQYNENWEQIHMYPEQSIQAAIDAGVKKATAVHWGAFALAQHHWKESVSRFAAAGAEKKLPMIFPEIGQIFGRNDTSHSYWWEAY